MSKVGAPIKMSRVCNTLKQSGREKIPSKVAWTTTPYSQRCEPNTPEKGIGRFHLMSETMISRVSPVRPCASARNSSWST